MRIKAEPISSSTTSSMGSDREYAYIKSALASFRTQNPSPTGLGSLVTDSTKFHKSPGAETLSRPQYDVRPKVSIPTDLAPQEYANQCIAAAESSRLNPYSLHPEEHVLLRAHLSYSQVTTYLNIRNGILRLWIRNPTISVLRDEAVGCCKDVRWFDVASLSYDWLVRRGYINYGCAEYVESRYRSPKPGRGKRPRKTIAVIGAGMSGLGCARQLEGLFAQYEDKFREKGEDLPAVVVLEGRDRVGGRVYSRGYSSRPTQPRLPKGNRCTAEMGGMIITGFDRGNPLNILVRGQLALPYHALRPTTTLYDFNGQSVDGQRDQLAEKLYNDVLERVSDYKFKTTQSKTIDGDRDLIDAGRDAHSDNNKMMKEIEEAHQEQELTNNASILFSDGLPQVEKANMVPVSSDRLTGKAHLEPGIVASHTAAFKAKNIGWRLRDDIDDKKDLDLSKSVKAPGATLGSVMDEALMQFRDVVHILPLDLRLMNWHIANLEYSNAINYKELSLGGWDVDAGNEWEGKHTMVIGGYQQVPRGLLQLPRPLKLKKKAVAKRIKYSSDNSGPALIECEDGTSVRADYVVSSIPLGVLKQQTVTFEPSLPDWKAGAIQRIGFGVLNKIVLVYKRAFWDQSRDIFGVLRAPAQKASLDQGDYSQNRGRFFQWFNVTKTSGMPTLLVLMAGDAAFHVETATDAALITEATSVLKSVFDDRVPDPVEAIVTRWGQDKFAKGSYSYTGPDFKADDYETMAKPIGNLFFTGEHTCGTHPATVHGAYISGLRAASEVLESIIGPITHPTPLLPFKETPGMKRKLNAPWIPEVPKDPRLARLQAYEYEVWDAIYKHLGDRPWKPAKISANPYILYGKDNFDTARKRCEEGRRPGKGKPVPNEVRIMLAKMWKEATEEEKTPYNHKANAQKEIYAQAMKEYTEKAGKWDKDALDFRKIYEEEHPSIPGPNEPLDDEWTRDRKAKKSAVYKEESGSEKDR